MRVCSYCNRVLGGYLTCPDCGYPTVEKAKRLSEWLEEMYEALAKIAEGVDVQNRDVF